MTKSPHSLQVNIPQPSYGKRTILLSFAMLGWGISTVLAGTPASFSPKVGPPISAASESAYQHALPYTNTQAVRLNKNLTFNLMSLAIQYDMPKLAYAAILRGGDYRNLARYSIYLRDWDFLQVYEHFAAMEGNPVRYTPDCWEELIYADERSTTPSDLYVPYDAVKIIPHLISKGVNINAPTSKGNTALSLALRTKDKRVIELVLAAGGKITNCTKEEDEILHSLGKPQKKERWNCYASIDPSTEYNKALIALSQALCDLVKLETVSWGAAKNETKLLQALDEAMVLVDNLELEDAQKIKNTLLLREVQCGCLAGVQYLVEKDGDVNFCLYSTDGAELLRYDLGTKADINSMAPDCLKKKRTILSAAIGAAHPKEEIIVYLMEQGARFLDHEEEGHGINARDEFGRTPLMNHLMGDLHSGTGDNARDLGTRLYIELGADVNALDKMGRNALFYALRDTSQRNLQALIEAGADVNCKPKDQHKTALYTAIELGNLLSTFLLLEAGANPLVEDAQGFPIFPTVRSYNTEKRKLIYSLVEAYRCAWQR